MPGLQLTIDPVEMRGFEYHTGLCFTLFARGVRGELGRGGRYMAGDAYAAAGGEPATGFTLYIDTLIRALPAPAGARRLYVPLGTAHADVARCAMKVGSPSPGLTSGNRCARGGAAAALHASSRKRASGRDSLRDWRTTNGERHGRRRPVGRRGQGQDRGLAVGARRDRRALPGRPQRRPHAGHRRPGLQARRCCRRASCGRASCRSSATASSSTRGRCSRRSSGCAAQGVDGHARHAAARRERDADPAAARRARPPARGSARRRRKIGTTGRGIGPAYEDKVGAARHPRLRPRRCAPRSSARSTSCWRTTTRCAAASAMRRSTAQLCAQRCSRSAPKILPFAEPVWDRARRGAARRQAHPVRGRAGRDARRRPRHLSVRHLVEHGRGAGGDRLRPRRRRRSATCSASSRPTRRASAAGRSRPS